MWVKIDIFSRVTLKVDGRPWKTIGHHSWATSNFVPDFIATCEFKVELQSRNGLIEFWPLWPWIWPLTLTLCMDITIVIGNNSWKFHDDMMMGIYWKGCDKRTDRRADWTVHRAAWSQLKSKRMIKTSHIDRYLDITYGQTFIALVTLKTIGWRAGQWDIP